MKNTSYSSLTLSYVINGNTHQVWMGEHMDEKLLRSSIVPAPSSFVVVYDKAIDRFKYDEVFSWFSAIAPIVLSIEMEVSESKKTTNYAMDLATRLSTIVDRHSIIVVIGGGVLGDLFGFCAHIILRGLRWIFIPTTLLAQVDSSVGGKTGVNTAEGKNLIGAFHPPLWVFSDVSWFKTLPKRHLRNGLVELVKHALIADETLFKFLDEQAEQIFNDSNLLLYCVQQSVELKLAIIGDDFFEHNRGGRRCFLNLGHTFGHAMEYLSGYSNELFHGEAVAKGILMAYRLSAHLGYATLNDVQRVENYFLSTGIDPLPTPWVECSDESKKKFLNAMMCDKKRINDQLNFILPKGIGKECVVFSTLPEMLLDFPIFD